MKKFDRVLSIVSGIILGPFVVVIFCVLVLGAFRVPVPDLGVLALLGSLGGAMLAIIRPSLLNYILDLLIFWN